MSMLAGPRVKQKVINLRAKNNDWSNDKNKFGQKMLEKMGWSEGKGLGAKENGIVEHVVARYKNDDKGLGYVDRNDQWTKHEDDFNALLANLSNTTNNEDIVYSGNSLEKKSKKSKARIHYHKFTRGKDLSHYSEKDLANIFGKKSLKKEINDNKKILNKEDNEAEQVFREKGSMDDYFKNKLAELKTKSKLFNEDYDSSNQNIPDYAFQGFKSTFNDEENESKEFEYVSSEKSNEVNNVTQTPLDEVESVKCKKKKKSKCTANSNDVCISDTIPSTCIEEITLHQKINMVKNDSYQSANCESPEIKKKRKKKSKNTSKLVPMCDESIDNVAKIEKYTQVGKYTSPVSKDNVNISVKKKRKKDKSIEKYNVDQDHEFCIVKSKKKNKSM